MQSTREIFQDIFLKCLENDQFRKRFRAILLEHDAAVIEPAISDIYERIGRLENESTFEQATRAV